MKPVENTENFVRRGKVKVATDPRMDRHVLDDSFAAMDEAIGRSSETRMMLQSRVARLAAVAAVILLAIGLLVIQWGPTRQVPSDTKHVAKSAADSLSALSLNMAYRRGGIEAVDALADVAFDLPGSKPARLSVQELLTESNGV